jgi:hypothetical protein
MFSYLVGALAARVAAVLCIVVVILPYFLRGNRFRHSFGITSSSPKPYLHRLWPHFWAGYFIAGLTGLHISLATGSIGRANVIGIWAASVSLLLLMLEIALGLSFKEPTLKMRKTLRRTHFWVMVVFVGALGIHLLFNG